MCGIFGFWVREENRAFNASLLRSGTQSLAHRGPDSHGFVGWTADQRCLRDKQLGSQLLTLGLGHTRLAILDLSPAGDQPMKGRDGTWITYNGEIYNYRELGKELRSLGFRSSTQTDTEIILNAYEAWGEDCISRFNGMWAFVLYDPHKGSLYVSRDRLGIKPLYYSSGEGYFAFASEVGALFHCEGITPHIVPEKLAAYLIDHRVDDGTDTIYRDIRELRGGHCMRLDLATGQVRSWEYWGLPQEPNLELSDEDALEGFSELIEDSVRLRLHADVPVTLTLSGGIDSSAISVAAQRVAGNSVHSFTSSHPNDPDIDETLYADQVVQTLEIESTLVRPSTGNLLEEEPKLTKHQAMPFASLSLYVHWAILSKIRSLGYPVALSGQGGDELFLGYERYYASAALSCLPNLWKLVRFLTDAGRNSQKGFVRMSALALFFMSPVIRRCVRFRRIKDVYQPHLLRMLPPPQSEAFMNLCDLQTSELRQRSLCTLLRYDDRTAAAHGMETRLPFLDYRLVEFAYRLPLRHKIRDGWTKYLVRRYLAAHLPKTIAWRKKKLGFNAPQTKWTDFLLAERGDRVLNSPFAKELLGNSGQMQSVAPVVRWDVYNILQLANILDWKLST